MSLAWGSTLAVLLLAAPGATAPAADGGAPPGPLRVEARCDRAAAPGRVRCEVEVRPAEGEALRWVDAQIVSVPAALTVLKGRIGPADATVREGVLWRLPFAVVARDPGRALVELRVRAVACRGDRCDSRLVPATVAVLVGEP